MAYFTFLLLKDLIFEFGARSFFPSTEQDSFVVTILLFLNTITESLESSGTGSGGGIFSSEFDCWSSNVS